MTKLFSLPVLAVLTGMATAALAKPAPEPQAEVSPDGHTFTLLPVPEADYVQVSLFWPGAAALSEPGKEGLLHLGANLPFEQAGGRTLDVMIEDLTDIGANVILETTFSGSTMILQAQTPAGLELAAEIASDVLTDAKLAQDDLDWLTTQVSDNLAQAERDPGGLMDRALMLLLADGDRRASALTNRPFSTVEAVTTDDVQAWMEASFDAGPVAIASGPLGVEEAGAAIDAMLADLGTRPAPVPMEPVVLRSTTITAVIDTPEAETALVAVAFPASPTDPAVTVALDALAGGDGTRLFSSLREEDGATYGIQLNVTPLTPQVMSVAFIGNVPPDRAQDTLTALIEEIELIRTEGVTQTELDAARERFGAQEDVFLRDPASLIGIGIDQSLRGEPIHPEDRRETDDMNNLAAINAAISTALPEGVVGVVVTPQPDLVEADCATRTPEDLGDCAAAK